MENSSTAKLKFRWEWKINLQSFQLTRGQMWDRMRGEVAKREGSCGEKKQLVDRKPKTMTPCIDNPFLRLSKSRHQNQLWKY